VFWQVVGLPLKPITFYDVFEDAVLIHYSVSKLYDIRDMHKVFLLYVFVNDDLNHFFEKISFDTLHIHVLMVHSNGRVDYEFENLAAEVKYISHSSQW